jgi:hypothetical protein
VTISPTPPLPTGTRQATPADTPRFPTAIDSNQHLWRAPSMRCECVSPCTVGVMMICRTRPSWAMLVGVAALSIGVVGSSDAAGPRTLVCPPISPSIDASGSKLIADRYKPAARALLACVRHQSVTGAEFSHWFKIDRIGDSLPGSRQRVSNRGVLAEVIDYLLRARWFIGEARDEHITVSDTQVRRQFEKQKREQFPTPEDFNAFLKQTGQTVPDILFRVRVNILYSRLLARFGSNGSDPTSLDRFDRHVSAKWKPLTYCRAAYTLATDCGHSISTP